MKKRLVILGSTGSIGRSALDVVARNSDRIEVVGLSTHSSIDLLLRQIDEFKPKYVGVVNEKAYSKFKNTFLIPSVKLLDPDVALERLSSLEEADIILNAIVGAAGLGASLSAARAGKRLALANKESMVIGGELLNRTRKQTGAEIVPVDSEHSAVWQAMRAGKIDEVRRIILTSSGGPFRDWPLEQFRSITREQALKHPVWNMGPKITIDSATMMNKGLEVIEAAHLFELPPEKIEVVIHPQSIIHSMAEFIDSSIIAQISAPDMRLPISYSLFAPERVSSEIGRVDLAEIGNLTFEKPDFKKFPLLKEAYRVAETGGSLPAVFNAANEVAVDAFLNNDMEFHRIPDIVIKSLERHNPKTNPSYNDLMEADRQGREFAREMI
jgi:1-deoxy-D-xylulose-5-phosphate reductoisomerase